MKKVNDLNLVLDELKSKKIPLIAENILVSILILKEGPIFKEELLEGISAAFSKDKIEEILKEISPVCYFLQEKGCPDKLIFFKPKLKEMLESAGLELKENMSPKEMLDFLFEVELKNASKFLGFSTTGGSFLFKSLLK